MISLRTLNRRLRGFIEPPRIKTLEQVNAPVALDGGRTPVRVVTRGSGRLVVGDVRLWVAGDFDDVVMVETRPTVRAVIKNLKGDDVQALKLEGLAVTPPPRMRLPHDVVARFGDLAPAHHDRVTVHLGLETPTVRAHGVRVPSPPALSPQPLLGDGPQLPIARTVAMRPRLMLPGGARHVGADTQQTFSDLDTSDA
jgi:hypothetical protein